MIFATIEDKLIHLNNGIHFVFLINVLKSYIFR